MVDLGILEEADDARYEATLAADLDTLGRLLHEDLVYGHSTGSVDSKASYLNAIESGGLIYHRLDRRNRRVMKRGATALIFCTLTMDVTVNGALRHLTNKTLSVWEKSGLGWQLLASHSTPLDRMTS